MTCQHCCGANDVFDKKGAGKQLKRYRKKGARKTSKRLIEGLSSHLNGHRSILDIGGGIGSVHIELMQKGMQSATCIDASESYLELAKDLAQEKGKYESVKYLYGDYIDHCDDIKKHDIVVLDKVICCYPYLNELLSKSISNSNALYGIVYPKNNIAGKIIIQLGNLWMKFKGSSFRVFMHSNEKVRAFMREKDFERIYYKTVYPWNIEVYKRIEDSKSGTD